MKIAAILAEFNPLHDGHRYIINKARELTGATYVLVVMSGNFTQRAEPAIMNKFARAKMAIDAGADAVVEIPTAFATGNAEVFAKAGVKIATSFENVTHLVFGIEDETTENLKLTAKQKDIDIKDKLKQGMGFDKARREFLKESFDVEFTPNNILALEYLRELDRLDSQAIPIGVKRVPGISSTAIRRERGFYESETFKSFGVVALYAMLTQLDTETYNSNIELVNLIKNLQPTSYTQLKRQAPTKRFSVSRIARLALHCTLGVTKKDIKFLYDNKWLPYTNLLAFKKEFLSELCKNSKTPVIIRGNKIKPKENAYKKALNDIDKRASDLYNVIQVEGPFPRMP